MDSQIFVIITVFQKLSKMQLQNNVNSKHGKTAILKKS